MLYTIILIHVALYQETSIKGNLNTCKCVTSPFSSTVSSSSCRNFGMVEKAELWLWLCCNRLAFKEDSDCNGSLFSLDCGKQHVSFIILFLYSEHLKEIDECDAEADSADGSQKICSEMKF